MTKYQLTKAAKARGLYGVELVMLRILYNINGAAAAEKALLEWPAKAIQGTATAWRANPSVGAEKPETGGHDAISDM